MPNNQPAGPNRWKAAALIGGAVCTAVILGFLWTQIGKSVRDQQPVRAVGSQKDVSARLDDIDGVMGALLSDNVDLKVRLGELEKEVRVLKAGVQAAQFDQPTGAPEKLYGPGSQGPKAPKAAGAPGQP